MAYSKTTWANGDVIDATKLNNLEDGVAANDEASAILSDFDSDDEGKVLTVDNDKLKWKTPPATSPYAMTGTLGEDADEKATITLDKTASDLFTAMEAGRLCKVMITIPGDEPITVTMILPCEAYKSEAGGNVRYTFKLRLDSEATDGYFYAADLAGSATVVLTEVASS